MNPIVLDLLWAVGFSVLGGIVGLLLILGASILLPRVIDRLTPMIDEEKEIARGNAAVAEYFGRVVGAAIIAVGIVIGAAVLGGILAALHG